MDENIKCFLEKGIEGTGKGTIGCLIRKTLTLSVPGCMGRLCHNLITR
jgi:hypothetical protein